MTTKHITEQEVHGTDVPTDHVDADTAQQAEVASRELLAKARYDAFRLMTEARDEAETILDEARAEAAGTKKAAEITAETVATKAAHDAAVIVESAREEAATIVAGAHRSSVEQRMIEENDELEAEHQALSDRVSTLRTLATQLDDRFAALAAPAAEVAEPEDAPEEVAPDLRSRTVDSSPSVETPEKLQPEADQPLGWQC